MKRPDHIRNKRGRSDRLPYKLKENHSFRVPEGYFETLPGRIMERINKADTAGENPFLKRRNKLAYVAAILILLAVVSGIFLINKPESDTYFAVDYEIPEEYMLMYLSDELSGAIVLNLAEENYDGLYSSEEILESSITDSTVTEEDILRYIYESGASTNEFYEN